MNSQEHSIIEEAQAFGERHLINCNLETINSKEHKILRQLAAESGFTKIEIPESQGGLGLDFKTRSKVFGVLSAFDFGFAMSIINTHSAALRLSQSAPPKIIDHFFPVTTFR